MDDTPLPRYPLPGRDTPDGAGEDMDWRLFFSRVVLHGVVALLLGGLLLSLAVLVTRGQIARLLDLFD